MLLLISMHYYMKNREDSQGMGMQFNVLFCVQRVMLPVPENMATAVNRDEAERHGDCVWQYGFPKE